MKKRVVFMLVLAVFILAGGVAWGDWTNPDGGQFHDDDNWAGTSPGPADNAIFNLDNTFTVDFDQVTETNQAVVTHGHVAFDLGGFDYTIGGFSVSAANRTLSLTLLNGTLINTGNNTFGNHADTHATLTVGAGALFRWEPPVASGTLFVGRIGEGFLNIIDGGGVETTGSRDIFVGTQDAGSPGATGILTVDGTGSRLVHGGSRLRIGANEGTGTARILNGGLIDVSGASNETRVGEDAGSTGTLFVSGANSEFRAGSRDLWLGGAAGANGTLHVENNGLAGMRELYVGQGAGSEGAVQIESGGTVNVSHSNIGFAGAGEVLVTGADSSFNASGVHRIYGVAAGHTGRLTVANGAAATGGFYPGYGDGTAELRIESGGTFTSAGVGTNFLGFDDGGTGIVTVTGTGSELYAGGHVEIGTRGTSTGHLVVEDGAEVTFRNERDVAHLYVGSGGDARTSTVTVRGSGSVLHVDHTDETRFGATGRAEALIEDGGKWINESAFHLGRSAGGSGYMTVTGTSARFEAKAALVVGNISQGELTVSNGGVVDAAGLVTVGNSSQNTVGNSITVTGLASRFNGTGAGMLVGSNAQGALTVENQGVVNLSGYLYAGNNAVGTGAVTVRGAGSLLNMGQLDVGRSGSGTLLVEDGGRVTPANFVITRSTGSTGAVTVTGTNAEIISAGWIGVGGQASVAEWGELGLGQGGVSAELTVEDSGVVSAGTRFYVFDTGTVTLRGGRVTAGTFMTRDDATLDLELDTPGGLGMIQVSGEARFYGAQLAFSLSDDFVFNLNDEYILLSYGTLDLGEAYGSLAGYTEGEWIDVGGYDFEFSYGTGADSAITLTAIPEPGAASLLLVAGAVAWAFRRRAAIRG